MSRSLLVMAKEPQPGRAKTRLTPPLTAAEAARLYACLLADTLDLVRSLPDIRPVLVFTPPSARDHFQSIASDFRLLLQQGQGLGARLDHALSACLAGGGQAVAIGSDSPSLPPAYIEQAYRLLSEVDVVLGPSEDGGYYLIGLKEPQPAILRPVQMSTPRVLDDTLALARQQGLRTALLPRWYDVDGVADLLRLAEDADRAGLRHTGAFLKEEQLNRWQSWLATS